MPGTNIKVPHVLVGDEAYPLKTYLMRPFPRENLTPSRIIVNQRLSRARQFIECTSGIISSKWSLLHKGIDVEPDFADLIIKAICLLHNIVIDLEGEDYISKYLDADIHPESVRVGFASVGENRSSVSAYNVREKFMAYFREN